MASVCAYSGWIHAILDRGPHAKLGTLHCMLHYQAVVEKACQETSQAAAKMWCVLRRDSDSFGLVARMLVSSVLL